uniref:Uncharacterized protein n=1 Tax=Caenorhabditis japonica TaxID=281687 RepID=A0A8R1DJE3_CAEJA
MASRVRTAVSAIEIVSKAAFMSKQVMIVVFAGFSMLRPPTMQFVASAIAVVVEWFSLKACWSFGDSISWRILSRITFSSTFAKEDSRDTRRKLFISFGSFPGFGSMNTLAFFQESGTLFSSIDALKSSDIRLMRLSGTCLRCKWHIPSGPRAFEGFPFRIASFASEWLIVLADCWGRSFYSLLLVFLY